MNGKFKKFTNSFLAFFTTLVMLSSNIVSVKGAVNDDFTVLFSRNGLINIEFNESHQSINKNDFYIQYSINNNTFSKELTITDVLAQNDTIWSLSFKALDSSLETQVVNYKISFKNGVPRTSSFSIYSHNADEMKIISSGNGSVIVEFVYQKTNITVSDFKNRLYINGYISDSNKKFTDITKISGYDSRYRMLYDKISSTKETQNISLEIQYGSLEPKTSEFVLYPDGNSLDGNIGSEYDHLAKPSFKLRSTKNGELEIRFDKELKVVLTKNDFYAKYYINGQLKGDLKITDVDEDPIFIGTDYTLYFDKLLSKEDNQLVTILLFNEREPRTQPVKGEFTINKDDVIYGIKIYTDEVKEFSGTTFVLPTIFIEEEGPNVIYPSSSRELEYIKLELPDGFEWTTLKNTKVTGRDGLKNAREYDVKYDTYKSDEIKNTILIGLNGISSDRTKKGYLELSGLNINVLEDHDIGEIKLRVSGAGIPYERYTVAEYIEKEVEEENNNTTKPTVEFKVVAIDGIKMLYVDGKAIPMDVTPYITDDRMFLPVSHIAVAFGISESNIKWDDLDKTNRTVTIKNNTDEILLTIDSQIMIKNGMPIVMDTKAQIKDNRTFIPIKFLGEALDFTIEWNPITRTATLVKKITVEKTTIEK